MNPRPVWHRFFQEDCRSETHCAHCELPLDGDTRCASRAPLDDGWCNGEVFCSVGCGALREAENHKHALYAEEALRAFYLDV